MSSYRKKLAMGPVTPTNTLTSSHSPPRPSLTSLTYSSLGIEERPIWKPPRRRGRRSHGSLKDVGIIEPGRDEISDDSCGDVLAAEEVKPVGVYSHSRLGLLDSADRHILQKPAIPKSKKRPCPASNTDEDELADGEGHKNGKHRGRPGKRFLVQSPVAVADPPSVSPTGSISRKVQTSSADVPAKGVNVDFPVAAAVCQKRYLYPDSLGSGEEEEACYLRAGQGQAGNELRIVRADGRPAEKYYHWLKVTNKINSLHYSHDCAIIKIGQPLDDSLKIGQLLVIKFTAAKVASSVVSWLSHAPGFRHVRLCPEEDGTRLEQTYQRTMGEIRTVLQNSATTRRVGGLDNQSQLPKENRVANSWRSDIPKRPAAPVLSAVSAIPAQPRDRIHLKDQMQLSTQDPDVRPSTAPSGQSPAASPGQPSVASSRQPSPSPRTLRTRSTYSVPDDVDIEPSRWSESNPDWSKDWKTPLSYNRTVVELDDVPRLDEGEYLNDNLIGFGLRYLYDNIGSRNQDLSKRVYMHNSFFFTKLKPGKGRQINYDGVKSWTSKVDLFSYDYIIVPVNENFHWWLAIIFNPRKLDPDFCDEPDGGSSPDLEITGGIESKSTSPSPEVATAGLRHLSIGEQEEAGNGNLGSGHKTDVDLVSSQETSTSEEAPSNTREATQRHEKLLSIPPTNLRSGDFRIITLDSLGRGHPAAVAALKSYLVHELKDKKKKEARLAQAQVGMKALNIPQQDNLCDCGVYLLGYMHKFFDNPDVFIQTLLRKEKPDWTVDANGLRENWRNIVLVQQKQHQDKTEQEKTKNKRVKLNPGTKMNERPEIKSTPPSSLVKKLDGGPENPTKAPSTPLKETRNIESTKTSPVLAEIANHPSESQAIEVVGKVDQEPVHPRIRTSSPAKTLNEGPDRRRTSSSPENVRPSPISTTGSPMKVTTPVKEPKATVVTLATDNILEVSPDDYYKSLNSVSPSTTSSARHKTSPQTPKATTTRSSVVRNSPPKGYSSYRAMVDVDKFLAARNYEPPPPPKDWEGRRAARENAPPPPPKPTTIRSFRTGASLVPISSPSEMVDWGRLSPSKLEPDHEYYSVDSSVPEVTRATALRHRSSKPIDLTEEEYTQEVYSEGPGVI